MCISSLAYWLGSQNADTSIQDRLPGGEVTNLFSIFLRILMKKKWLGNRRKRFCGETLIEGEGHVKTRETLYVWSMCMMVLWRLLCWIHMGEHSVHARSDYWIWSQNCRNTLLWHEQSTSECTKWDTVMVGGDELSENSNPLLALVFDDTT